MDVWAQWAVEMVKGLPALLIHPLTYVLLIIIALLWRWQINRQRRLFGTRLHTVGEGVLHSLAYGLASGLLASMLLFVLGAVYSPEAIMYLWLIALVLSCIHVRYLCFAYAGSLLAVFVLAARYFSLESGMGWLDELWAALSTIHLPSLFALVAVLHLAEGFMIRRAKSRLSQPIYLQGKRGRLVGGYDMQYIWFVPLFLLSEGGQASLSPLFEGWPLFSASLPYLSVLCFPAVSVYMEQTVSSTPKQKAGRASLWFILYGLLLLLLSYASVYVEELLIATILFTCLGHAAHGWFSRYQERKSAPLFIHPVDGLKVLTVIPGTPAEEMGLQSGEVILKANGMPVRRRKQLYAALARNRAFCKLEVRNENGEQRFLNRSLYESDHHELGIVLVPDSEVPYYLEGQNVNLWHLLGQQTGKKRPLSAGMIEKGAGDGQRSETEDKNDRPLFPADQHKNV